ncbi:hypothetical protein GCM10009528_23450 [Kineococcus aurantiacus]
MRSFLVGTGPSSVPMLLLTLLFVASAASGARAPVPRITANVIALTITVLEALYCSCSPMLPCASWLGRPRLGHLPLVHRQVLTTELGILAAVLDVSTAMARVVVPP